MYVCVCVYFVNSWNKYTKLLMRSNLEQYNRCIINKKGMEISWRKRDQRYFLRGLVTQVMCIRKSVSFQVTLLTVLTLFYLYLERPTEIKI